MLTVSGIVAVANDPEEKTISSGTFFSFKAVGKNPYAEGRKHYNMSVFVPVDQLDSARTVLKRNMVLNVRMAELDGNESEKGFIYNQVKVNYRYIDPLKSFPTSK
jgi:hypothetical protein